MNADPSTFRVQRPSGPSCPVVLDSPHSGTRYPDDFGSVLPLGQLRDAEDAFVDELYADAPRHGAPLLCAQVARIYLDCNRAADDLDAELIENAGPGASESAGPGASGKAKFGKSLVWRLTDRGEAIYARRLTPDEVHRRIAAVHAPYHAALRGLLDAAVAAHGAVWHVNCHSMPAVGGAMSADAGRERADVVLGDRDGSTCEAAFTALVREFFLAHGYSVRVNDPFKGVELVRAYSDPARRRHSLQIELNRRLYMDERSRSRNEGFGKLRRDLDGLVAAIAVHAKEST